MSEALITPELLNWARERSKLSIQELSTKISQDAEMIKLWEKGEKKPTFIQAQKIAHVLHIPFGYLFLKTPPIEEERIPDLRTISDKMIDSLSIDLKDVLKDAQRKQDWYSDLLKENGDEALSFVGRYNLQSPTNNIVEDINRTLDLTFQDRTASPNWEAFLRLLINKAEDAGIWVMRNSKVGNNTRRVLNVEEFRGFALCDSHAPLVFINSADAKAAQIFTIIHEIVHLWLGESGISDIGLTTDRNHVENLIEQKCNEVAAELLVPYSELKQKWNDIPINENISNNSNFFKVSKIVIARRALDLMLISASDFFSYYQTQKEIWDRQKQKQKESEGGPSFYRLLPIYNGRKFTEAVLISVFTQQTLVRNGARLLGVKPDKIDKIAHEAGLV